MSELRHDPIQKRWVIIATERGRRPSDFMVEPEPTESKFCPFCDGNEGKTPPEIFAIRDNGSKPNTQGWSVRVVPNKFPALAIEGDLNREGMGLFDRMNGIGAHEVVIESPNHHILLADQPVEHFTKILSVYQNRINDLMNDLRLRYILVFKNQGSVAGASLTHPHTQIIATPVTPRTVALELDSAKEHYGRKERCLFCDIIAQEIREGVRVVTRNEHFICFTPFASRFPFEIFLAPVKHCHDFAEEKPDKLYHLALSFKDILWRLKKSLNNPPYNFVLHSAPNTRDKGRRPSHWQTLAFDFHWHIEIIPRLTKMAGFEWGTGFYINPTPPEDAAKYLREISEEEGEATGAMKAVGQELGIKN
jgi:UDPglucose--hexose-1-phosphate uridylyltransferase